MAKVTISFVTSENNSKISIESDQERNKDFTGKVKTVFRYGDTAYFRVYSHEPDKINVKTTDGTLSDMGIYTDNITDEVLAFYTEQTAQTEKAVKALNSYTWLGNALGNITLQDSYTLRAEDSPLTGNIAAAKVSYQSIYRLYGLTLTKKDMETYPVHIYVESANV